MASLGAGLKPRSTVQLFMPVSAVEKPPLSQFFFLGFGCHLARKSLSRQQCQFQTRNKSLSSENELSCSMTSGCLRTGSLLPRGDGLEQGRCKQSIFSLSTFGILVERLSFQRLHFCSDLLRFFSLSSSMQGLNYIVTDFLISTCEKSYASSKPTG